MQDKNDRKFQYILYSTNFDEEKYWQISIEKKWQINIDEAVAKCCICHRENFDESPKICQFHQYFPYQKFEPYSEKLIVVKLLT